MVQYVCDFLFFGVYLEIQPTPAKCKRAYLETHMILKVQVFGRQIAASWQHCLITEDLVQSWCLEGA